MDKYSYNNKEYNNPFEEIREFIQACLQMPVDELSSKIPMFISNFISFHSNRLNISNSDLKHFKLKTQLDVYPLSMDVSNMFTACIVYGRMVPNWICEKYPKRYDFEDGDYIELNSQGSYIYYKLLKAENIKITGTILDKDIHKEFVTGEIASELSKLGMEYHCVNYLNLPLWQQAIDYLRINHKIIVEPCFDFIESRTFNVALIQDDELNPLYHATDIIEEPDFYKAREQGILQAIQLIKDGALEFVKFENWFTKVLELWEKEGMYKRIQLDKSSAKMQYELGMTPDTFVEFSKQDFK